MSDSMETGGFGKNPAIDKINRINTAKSRMSAVTELEKKVFQPVQPKQKAVLDKRKQITQEFHIDFKKGGKQENETVLHGGERRLLTGQYPVHSAESGQDRFTVRTPRRVLPDGRGQAAQLLPAERATGNHSGEWQRRADNSTVIKAESGTRPITFRSGGSMPADKGDVSQIRNIAGISVQGREASGRLVSDGNDRYQYRTYQGTEHSKRVYGTADIHVSNQRIHEVEKHHTAEFQNIKGERGQDRWKELTKKM
ncbi:MAG: hypothetical protein K2M91_13425 [Lachnospiraceae bacterium]|nr:hypothetical protein [Lachnospiraceae bacterium]